MPYVVLRINKFPGRKKNPLKFLTVLCESLDHGRHHRRSRRKGILWKEKRMRAFPPNLEWERMGKSVSRWDLLPALFCVLWRFYTSEWMTEWCTQRCWNLCIRFSSSTKISCPQAWVTQCYRRLQWSPHHFCAFKASSWRILQDWGWLIWDLGEIWFITRFKLF